MIFSLDVFETVDYPAWLIPGTRKLRLMTGIFNFVDIIWDERKEENILYSKGKKGRILVVYLNFLRYSVS